MAERALRVRALTAADEPPARAAHEGLRIAREVGLGVQQDVVTHPTAELKRRYWIAL